MTREALTAAAVTALNTSTVIDGRHVQLSAVLNPDGDFTLTGERFEHIVNADGDIEVSTTETLQLFPGPVVSVTPTEPPVGANGSGASVLDPTVTWTPAVSGPDDEPPLDAA
jgi:hypothetical protein